jgi:hypothetical protein
MKNRPYGEPVLIYLVEQGKDSGLYCGRGRVGITAGVTAWSDDRLQFTSYRDAAEFANTIPEGNIVKLRLYARQEPIRPAKHL